MILPWLSSCKDDEVSPEIKYNGVVGIIGAGAAGLFAADYLLKKGVKVEIYEASHRIGGRVRSLRPLDSVTGGLWYNQQTRISSDFPVELGADRIYGDNEIWARFVNQQKYTTVSLPANDKDLFWLDGALVDHETALLDSDFAAAEAFLTNLGSNAGSAQSVLQAIDGAGLSSGVRAILEGWIGTQYGSSNSRIGIGGIAEEISDRERNANAMMLKGNPMSDVIIGSFIQAAEKTMLNTIIRSVDYQGEKVVVNGERIVSGASQPFTSTVDKLLITVPVSILKGGEITFSPALPSAKTSALSNIGIDQTIRVVLDFRRNFWEQDFRSIYGGTTGPEYFNPNFDKRSDVSKTLSVTIGGAKAEELSPLGLDMVPELLSELDGMFDGKATPNIRLDPVNDEYIVAIQDWGQEPFIKGGVSYLKPGATVSAREALSKPVKNVLFFAGEATDVTGEAGTVNGALLSAERAAKEIVDSILA